MAGRSIAGQKTQIQKEVTPGTALTNAMLLVEALRLLPSSGGDAEPFKGISGKVATSVTLPDLVGNWSATAVQCFNAIGLVAASRIAVPVTTTPGGATNARQHVFSMNPDAEDTKRTYTVQFGDATVAVQGAYGVFQTLGLNVERGALAFTTSMLTRELDYGATLATSGVTTMSAVPIPPRGYDVWADDAWADLGTTLVGTFYRMNMTLGDKFVPDAPINSAITSYESAMEQQDQDYTFDAMLRLDATAVTLVEDVFKLGEKKYFRIAATGPEVETGVDHMIQLDFAATIRNVGEIGQAPNSPAVSLPLTLDLARDSAGANTCELTLVNGILAY